MRIVTKGRTMYLKNIELDTMNDVFEIYLEESNNILSKTEKRIINTVFKKIEKEIQYRSGEQL